MATSASSFVMLLRVFAMLDRRRQPDARGRTLDIG
jgi:hypothetical protein